jgi:hypothetical protein
VSRQFPASRHCSWVLGREDAVGQARALEALCASTGLSAR